MKVHSVLGNGFQEVIYQRALEIEMRKAGLGFARELEMNIYYDGEEIGRRRVDFFVEGVIIPIHPGETDNARTGFVPTTSSGKAAN